jgi:hypothetical protein
MLGVDRLALARELLSQPLLVAAPGTDDDALLVAMTAGDLVLQRAIQFTEVGSGRLVPAGSHDRARYHHHEQNRNGGDKFGEARADAQHAADIASVWPSPAVACEAA